MGATAKLAANRQRSYDRSAKKIRRSFRLKNRNFEVQEFLGVLAEITDQQPQVTGQAGQIVVKLRI
jgi:hypothetical protein